MGHALQLSCVVLLLFFPCLKTHGPSLPSSLARLFHSTLAVHLLNIFMTVLVLGLVRPSPLVLRFFHLGLCLGENILKPLPRLRGKFGNRISHNDSTLDQFFGNGTENNLNT